MAWYEYPTNYSNGTTVDGVGKMFIKYPSSILNGAFSGGVILLIWIVTFLLSVSFGTSRAIAISSFISFIFSIFLMKMGSINLVVPITLIILTIVGVLGAKGSNQGGSM